MMAMVGGFARRQAKGLVLLAFGGMLGACNAVPEMAPAAEVDSRVFLVGYRHIAYRYIEPVDIGTLAVAGLEQLSQKDASLGVMRSVRSIRLVKGGATLLDQPMPADQDIAGWARLTADFLTAAARESVAVRAESNAALYRLIYDGVTGRLDRYSRYADAEHARRQRDSRDGFGGIGVMVDDARSPPRIARVFSPSPGAAAGLAEGDEIVRVDGRFVSDLTGREIGTLMRGAPGTSLSLTVWRPTSQQYEDFSVRRDLIVPPSVTSETRDGILYIRISTFNQHTAQSVREAVAEGERALGTGLRGVLLDLRNNPGGLLDQGAAVADIFLSHGRILSTQGRNPNSNQIFDAGPAELAAGRPLVVLLNGKSASASEVVALAITELGRGIAVGSSSYGKGTVQTILSIPHGGELTLTWSRLLGPKGTALSGHGVVPMLCTGSTDESAAAILTAMRLNLPHTRLAALAEPVATGVDAGPWPDRDACPPVTALRAVDVEIGRQIIASDALYLRLLPHGRTIVADHAGAGM